MEYVPTTKINSNVILAVNDGVTLGSQLDGVNLYRPYLQLVVSAVVPAGDAGS